MDDKKFDGSDGTIEDAANESSKSVTPSLEEDNAEQNLPQIDFSTDVEVTFEVDESSDTADSKNSEGAKENASPGEIVKDPSIASVESMDAEDTNSTSEDKTTKLSDQTDPKIEDEEVPMEINETSEDVEMEDIEKDKSDEENKIVKVNLKDDSQETVSNENSVDVSSPVNNKEDTQELKVGEEKDSDQSESSVEKDITSTEKDVTSTDKDSQEAQENEKDTTSNDKEESQDEENGKKDVTLPEANSQDTKEKENDTSSTNSQDTKEKENDTSSTNSHDNKEIENDISSTHSQETKEIDTSSTNSQDTKEKENDTSSTHSQDTKEKENDTSSAHSQDTKEKDTSSNNSQDTKEKEKDTSSTNKTTEEITIDDKEPEDSKKTKTTEEITIDDKEPEDSNKNKENEESKKNTTSESKSSVKENSETGADNVPNKSDPDSTKKEPRLCAECNNTKGLKYQILYQGKTRYLCSDNCFKVFREKQNLAKNKGSEKCVNCLKLVKKGFLAPVLNSSPTCSEDCLKQYLKKKSEVLSCHNCKKDANLKENGLLWEAMEFCGDDCVSEIQVEIGRKCVSCTLPVPVASLGKYCVRFGMEIRQFCTGKCLDDFKKGLKVCSFCQQDISKNADAMVAQVGEKGVFKDFCNNTCMEKYESIFSKANATTERTCAVCTTKMITKIKVNHKNENHFFCNPTCLASFCFVQKISQLYCEMCHTLFDSPKENHQSLICENLTKNFCTKQCLNLFILTARKIVQCFWCKVKKYNFDMISHFNDNQNQTFCSLNCYCQFTTNSNPALTRKSFCDHCYKWAPASFHLTMSDNSIRNFCAYNCVLSFQSQFNAPALTTTKRQVTPVGVPTNSSNTPLISNIKSLSNSTSVNSTKILKPSNANSPLPIPTDSINPPVTQNIIREVIVRPPLPKPVKNKMTQCKPISSTKGVSCKPLPCHKSTQTEGSGEDSMSGLIPIPIPIFIPTPVHMFTRTVPSPMPFPIPLPVPIFIPTPHTSFQHINNHIKAIQEGPQDNNEPNTIATNGQEDFAKDEPTESIEDTLEVPKSAKRKLDSLDDNSPSKKFKEDVHSDYEELKPFMATGLRWQYGLSVYNQWLETKNKSLPSEEALTTDLISMSQEDLCNYLCMFVQELRRPNDQPYSPDILYYFCLGIQSNLTENGREDNIFSDKIYHKFTSSLNEVLEKNSHTINLDKNSLFIVNEEILWSNKELGAHSPYILLNTILYFNSRYYHLKTTEEHQGLCFSHLSKKWKKGKNVKNPVCYLTYTPPNQDSITYDQPETPDNQMRCPVKFHEFYISKCPESAKSSKGPFYLYPIQDVKPDSPVWFSTDPLDPEAISKMLLRIKFVKELYN